MLSFNLVFFNIQYLDVINDSVRLNVQIRRTIWIPISITKAKRVLGQQIDDTELVQLYKERIRTTNEVLGCLLTYLVKSVVIFFFWKEDFLYLLDFLPRRKNNMLSCTLYNTYLLQQNLSLFSSSFTLHNTLRWSLFSMLFILYVELYAQTNSSRTVLPNYECC